MKKIVAWAKANPISVGSAVLALVAVAMLFVIRSNGGSFMKQMSQHSSEINRIKSLQRTSVRVPPARPDDPERQLQITVNQAAIDQLSRVYTRIGQEYAEISKLAIARNRAGHTPMLNGLFPEANDPAAPFEVKDVYRSILVGMLDKYSSSAKYPRLDASPPPTADQLEALLEKVEKSFLEHDVFPSKESVDQLTGKEAAELDAIKRAKLITFLQEYARSIHLYAETKLSSPGFPFDVGQWSKSGLRPAMSDIWEGQLGLWIQQDIAQVIARTNRVEDSKSNVLNVPIKRLISIRVVPGYVGLGGAKGGLFANQTAPGATARAAILDQGSDSAGDSQASHLDDFSLSPTGRRSDGMYDVRHVSLSVVIDSQMMPEFFENLQQVNFMTVLNMSVTAIDEYEALRQGYVYGPGDSIQADMLIETIWLRDWTTPLMPRLVRRMLGVDSDFTVRGGQ